MLKGRGQGKKRRGQVRRQPKKDAQSSHQDRPNRSTTATASISSSSSSSFFSSSTTSSPKVTDSLSPFPPPSSYSSSTPPLQNSQNPQKNKHHKENEQEEENRRQKKSTRRTKRTNNGDNVAVTGQIHTTMETATTATTTTTSHIKRQKTHYRKKSLSSGPSDTKHAGGKHFATTTTPTTVHDCSQDLRPQQESLLLSARIQNISEQTAVWREDGTTKLPVEYSTPAHGSVHCMHCSLPITSIPVPIAFSLNASRTPPVYQIGHFFCSAPCGLAYIIECLQGDPDIYAHTKQLYTDAYGMNTVKMLPAPPRFAMQRHQRNPSAGLSDEAFEALRQSPNVTTQGMPPILQNYDQGFVAYSACKDQMISRRFSTSSSSFSKTEEREEINTKNSSERGGQRSGRPSTINTATSAPHNTAHEMLSLGRPKERDDPLCDPEFCEDMPPLLDEAYKELFMS